MKKFSHIILFAGLILLFTAASGQARSVSDSTLIQRFQKFETLESLEAREEYYRETRKAFPLDSANFTSRFTHDMFLSQLAKQSLLAEKPEKYRRYHAALADPELLSVIMGKLLLDWAEAGQNTAKIRPTGERYLQELEHGPETMRGSVRTLFLEKFGSALLRIGEDEKALDYLQAALEDPEPKKTAFLADYAVARARKGELAEAKNILATAFQLGENQRKLLLGALKEVFALEGSNPGSYEAFLAALDSKAYEQVYEEVKTRWKEHSESAPDFQLRNLEGETVSLADLKGKVVVLDFWATWCIPCKASFPGMQLAVEAYADDPEVQFFFVNSYERPEEALQKVTTYINRSGYTFEVLMDSDNKVAEAFGVELLPSKIVIGPDGRIRFFSPGLDGNNQAVLNHVKAMVEITRHQDP